MVKLMHLSILQIILLAHHGSSAFAPIQARSKLTSLSSSSPPASSKEQSSGNYKTFGDATLSTETFSEHFPSLPKWLTDRATECGWAYPTIIQDRAISSILEGKDVIIQSQTGSGKTLAYILPLLSKIEPNRSSIQAVIIVPTRELGVQVARVTRRLAAASSEEYTKKIMLMSVLQGSGNKRQRAWARADPPHIIIGTPREMAEMFKRGGMKYHAVKYVVVDEVDSCLLNNAGTIVASDKKKSLNVSGSGPLHELLSRYLSPTFVESEEEGQTVLEGSANGSMNGDTRVISHGTDRQTVFVSATIPQHNHFLKQCIQNQWMTREPEYICASPGELVPPTLGHVYLVCKGMDQKMAGLVRMIHKEMDKIDAKGKQTEVRVLVFSEPKRPLEKMSKVLEKELGKRLNGVFDVKATVLRYEDSTTTRVAAMEEFRGTDTYLGGRIMDDNDDDDDNDDSEDDVEIIKESKEAAPTMEDKSSSNDAKRSLRILLSTDLAARGLDIAEITHVINYDLPHEGDTYVHRGGRAGRLGRKGLVMSIITNEEEFVLERLANKLGLELKCIARQQAPKR